MLNLLRSKSKRKSGDKSTRFGNNSSGGGGGGLNDVGNGEKNNAYYSDRFVCLILFASVLASQLIWDKG